MDLAFELTKSGHPYSLFPEDRPRTVAMVLNGTDGLESAVMRANEALTTFDGWHIDIETGGTYPMVTPVVLTSPFTPELADRPDGGDGQASLAEVEEALMGIPGLHALIGPVLDGAVVHKTFALTRGDLGRVPVAIPWDQPAWPAATGRRKVVAMLDTAVEPHRWLGQPDSALGGPGFWVDARRMGWNPGPRLKPPHPHGDVLDRALGEQEGHGTFTAGLVRRIAPTAQVLAVHTIADDGTVQGDHVLNALAWLLDQLEPGDVVCLPIGWRPALAADRRYLRMLAVVLGKLADRRVTVVAAAGNDGADDPIYPAAFAASDTSPLEFRIRSVGALNVEHDPTPAYYSNSGGWVTAWEVGTSLISSFPAVNAAGAAELSVHGRRSADPDDFSEGFARWSGTSFAAAVHAAKVAAGKA
jgi:subtilisin family serine protease